MLHLSWMEAYILNYLPQPVRWHFLQLNWYLIFDSMWWCQWHPDKCQVFVNTLFLNQPLTLLDFAPFTRFFTTLMIFSLFLFLFGLLPMYQRYKIIDSESSGVNGTSLTSTMMTTTTTKTTSIPTSTVGSLAGEYAALYFYILTDLGPFLAKIDQLCPKSVFWLLKVTKIAPLPQTISNKIWRKTCWRLRRGECECEFWEPGQRLDNPWNQFATALQWKVQVWKHWKNYKETKLSIVVIITGQELAAATGFGIERLHPGVAKAFLVTPFKFALTIKDEKVALPMRCYGRFSPGCKGFALFS